jgi:nucleoside-diphosphate-sugar epimerase
MVAKILVTGASGFIGRALLDFLRGEAWDVLGTVRGAAELTRELVHAPELSPTSNWREVLADRNIVVHTAARAHVLKETEKDPLAVFRMVNTEGTLNLARQAASMGIRRFIFISSIGVNGAFTPLGQSFTEHCSPAPHNPYAISKWEAEQGLRHIARETGMEVVIIRPPLVYGSGVRANFHIMMQWLQKGFPLPLGAVHNKRSLVGLENLVDLIITCLDHPAAANQVFLAGDGEDLSTPELLCRLGLALGKPARLLPVPASLLKAGAALLGRRDIAQRLCESLQVDISKARNVLGWNPPISVDEGFRRTAKSFLAAVTK